MDETRLTHVPQLASTSDIPRKTLPQVDPNHSGWRETQHAMDLSEGTLPEIPHPPGYQLLKVLGHGGMGVVYLANQESLQRKVAIKCLLGGPHASPPMISRFRNEAELIARLRHQHIVQIHEVGKHQGSLFYVMEYCEGGSLHEKLQRQPMEAKEAATLVLDLARAMAAAHQARIIHRDLKPHNILLTATGEPKISDFGLARHLTQDRLTETGKAIGTPWYMAPEQARGESDQIGPAADIYSLGAILYECLTGRPPFLGASPEDTLRQVVECDPVPARRWISNLPRDLDTITMKCLQKLPSRRYGSMLELVQDLEHFLDHKPIEARPIGVAERAYRWCRRNPTIAILAGSMVCVLALATIGAILLSGWAIAERNTAKKEANNAWIASQNADAAAILASRRETEARKSAKEARDNFYLALMAMIDRDWNQQERAQVRDLLDSLPDPIVGEDDQKGWEWYLFDAIFDRSIAKHSLPDVAPRLPVQLVRYSPLGDRYAATGVDGVIHLFEETSGKKSKKLIAAKEILQDLIWSPDGFWLASCGQDKAIHFWPMNSRAEPFSITGLESNPIHLGWSADGEYVAASGEDRQVRIWNLQNRSVPALQFATSSAIDCLQWHPSMSELFVGSQDGTLHWIKVAAGKIISQDKMKLPNSPRGLAIDAKRNWLYVSQGNSSIRRINLNQNELMPSLEVSAGASVQQISLANDGNVLFAVADEQTIELWDTQQKRHLLDWHGHDQAITSLSVHPKWERVLSSSLDGKIRLWEGFEENLPKNLMKNVPQLNQIAWDQSSSSIWTLSNEQGLARLNRDHRGKTLPPLPSQFRGELLAVHPLDSRIAIASATEIQMVDPDQDRAHVSWSPQVGELSQVRWAPAGNLLALANKQGEVSLWETFQPKMRKSLRAHVGAITDIAFNADGTQLVTAGEDAQIRFWDVATGEPIGEPIKSRTWITRLNWARTGTLFLADHAGQLLAMNPSERTLQVCGKSKSGFRSLSITKDGKRLATASNERGISIWDVATKRRLFILPTQTEIQQVAWSSDQQAIVAATTTGDVLLWDLRSRHRSVGTSYPVVK